MKLLIAAMSFFIISTTYAQDFTEGKDYTVLKEPVPTSTNAYEIVEVLGHWCPHCNELEPHIKKWKEDKGNIIKFIRVPAIFKREHAPLAHAYYASEIFGIENEFNQDLFDSIHNKGIKPKNLIDASKLFTKYGISESDALTIMKSYKVRAKVKNAIELLTKYEIDSVPTIILDGRFATNSGYAGSHQKSLKVIDYLMELR